MKTIITLMCLCALGCGSTSSNTSDCNRTTYTHVSVEHHSYWITSSCNDSLILKGDPGVSLGDVWDERDPVSKEKILAKYYAKSSL